ncbi:PREDICTED: mediator of RNA polymerase II transcription subunit 23-like, partial [Amphimedon queenslandica]|uniref:Mediator of RNA polymerase II transcription subunit 23 n=1 Tax=Amphimedon queenslandica TaxID=400682 RepID=A0AAN0JY42_AMPQE
EQFPFHIKEYVKYMISQTNPHCVELLSDTMETLVNRTSLIPARAVCEVVLSEISTNNLMTWKQGLTLIHNIIGAVDYKGCRDVMKLLLDKFDAFPRSIPEKLMPAIYSGRKILNYILDRNASLMPSYMAHDEIQRRYSPPETHPHWALKDIIASLKGGMEVVAGLVSGNMLPNLVPVIGCSNTAGNAWKLDQDKTCFSLPGRLPYSQVMEYGSMKVWKYRSTCIGYRNMKVWNDSW